MAGDRISLCGNRYEIVISTPLSQYDQPGAKAYAVQAGRGASNHFALVPGKGEFPRHDMFHSATTITSLAALRFVDSDVVHWPEFDRHRPILVYERPTGIRMMSSVLDDRPALHNEVVFRQAVESIYEGLRDVYMAGLSHGRINPTNVFVRDVGSGFLQLGECLSTIPGKYQHYAFETIERMMADPAGRGPTRAAEDIYAAGVTLLVFLLGRLPALAWDQATLLHAKLEKGSMMALISGLKLPSAFSEIFRGMLADDINQRWDLDDISHWLGGRRMGSKPAAQIRKAQRLFEIGGKGYNNPRQLAYAMTQNIEQASAAIEDGSIDRWLRRSIGDETLAVTVGEAISSASGIQRGGTPAERLVSRTTIAMDLSAPIRFREVAVTTGGIGTLLAQQMANNQTSRSIADALTAHLPTFWLNAQGVVSGEFTSLQQLFDGCRILLERTQHGFGIERVLYELNASLPCLSPMVESHYPLNLKSLASALEDYASTVGPEETTLEPMDRHIAAFVLTHHRRMNDRLFPLLAKGSEQGQHALAILSILAELQKKFHTDPLPHLGEWISRMLMPATERFSNRATREQVQRDIKRLGRKGDLVGLLALLDDSTRQHADSEGFNEARTEWHKWERIARDMTVHAELRHKAQITISRQITAIAAVASAMIALVITIIVKLI